MTQLRPEGDRLVLDVAGVGSVASRAVVLALGVSYTRLGVDSLEALLGAGVFYGAAVSEARAMAGEDVCVVGGANSAGQAALHLARYARHVTLVVRGDSLETSMSDYLIQEIAPPATSRFVFAGVSSAAEGRGDSITSSSRGRIACRKSCRHPRCSC